jgi:hypothetical protein
MGGAALGQPRRDPAGGQGVSVRLGVVATIALDDAWPADGGPDSTGHRRHTVDQRQQLRYVVPVRGRETRDKRNPVRVGKNMMFRPGLAAIGRVRSSFFPPRNARREALSTTTHFKLTWPRRRSSANSTRWSRFHTPARCQRSRRRQQVVPEPQPISFGNMFQGTPLRSTNRMPVSTARSGIGRRPAYRRCRERRFGNNGSMCAHNSSSTKVMRDHLGGHATVPTLRSEYKRVVI